MSSTTSNTRNRLRRSMSTRSMQKPRRDPRSVTPDVVMQHAAAAASRAMRSSQSSSQESRSSYDRFGGPANIAVPRRRPGSSLRQSDDHSSARQGDASGFSNPSYPKESSKPYTQIDRLDDPAALPPITEFKGLDGRNSSVPSSYRRLRKAKSMFATRPRTSQTPYGVPPLPCGDPSDPERSPGFQLPRTMRPSMPFLRGNQQQQQPDGETHDAAVKLARSQFTVGSGESNLRHQRSSFLLRRKKDHKPFRKSFRATSEAVAPLGDQKAGCTRTTSRSFSNSIKNRLKRVFGFSKSVAQQPPLQTDSTRVETAAFTSFDPNMEDYLPYQHSTTDRCDIPHSSRVTPDSPSRGSFCTSKSRVTSWADSTIANTVTTRKPAHRQSLSMIREDGNSTLRTPVKDDVSHFIPPVMRTSPRLIGNVDSRDLYNALMEQIGNGAVSDPHEDVFLGSITKHHVVPSRSESVFSQHGRQTIRHVPSRESSTSPRSFTTARCGDQSSPQKHHLRPAKSMQAPRSRSAHDSYQNILACFDPQSPPPNFVVKDDDDDDDGSIIITRFQDFKRNVISPSIYSRTTGGNTPIKADTLDTLEMGVYDEPGTATIFASERSTYVSPNRAAPKSCSTAVASPSGDWHQWVGLQIDRIEQASPTREHIREDAQFQEDNDLAIITRQAPLTTPKVQTTLRGYSGSKVGSKMVSDCSTSTGIRLPSQSNFSRPFGQVPNIQPILPLQTVKLRNSNQNVSGDPVKESSVDSVERVSPRPIPIYLPQGLSPNSAEVRQHAAPRVSNPEEIGHEALLVQRAAATLFCQTCSDRPS